MAATFYGVLIVARSNADLILGDKISGVLGVGLVFVSFLIAFLICMILDFIVCKILSYIYGLELFAPFDIIYIILEEP